MLQSFFCYHILCWACIAVPLGFHMYPVPRMPVHTGSRNLLGLCDILRLSPISPVFAASCMQIAKVVK